MGKNAYCTTTRTSVQIPNTQVKVWAQPPVPLTQNCRRQERKITGPADFQPCSKLSETCLRGIRQKGIEDRKGPPQTISGARHTHAHKDMRKLNKINADVSEFLGNQGEKHRERRRLGMWGVPRPASLLP